MLKNIMELSTTQAHLVGSVNVEVRPKCLVMCCSPAHTYISVRYQCIASLQYLW